LEAVGNVVTRVPAEAFAGAGVQPRGELWVAMLDTKQSWDDLVRRHAPDARTRDAILANPLYTNITGKFVQSHDYIAMERLFEIHASGRYDLLVVDTPPTRNALDFLDAPARMAEFFSSRLLRWLTVPYRSRFLTLAPRPRPRCRAAGPAGWPPTCHDWWRGAGPARPEGSARSRRASPASGWWPSAKPSRAPSCR